MAGSKTPGTDVATVEGEATADLIMGKTLPDIEDAEAAQKSIVEAILRAEDLGELFQDRSTTATKDIIAVPCVWHDLTLRRGEIDGKEGTYALIDVTNMETGKRMMLNSGAPNLVATLIAAKARGFLPLEAAVVEVGQARQGRNAPLGLMPMGDTAKAVAAAQAGQ